LSFIFFSRHKCKHRPATAPTAVQGCLTTESSSTSALAVAALSESAMVVESGEQRQVSSAVLRGGRLVCKRNNFNNGPFKFNLFQ